MEPLPRNKSLAKPILSYREQLQKLLGWKDELVRRPVVKLNTYRELKATEGTLRFRIDKERRENESK